MRAQAWLRTNQVLLILACLLVAAYARQHWRVAGGRGSSPDDVGTQSGPIPRALYRGPVPCTLAAAIPAGDKPFRGGRVEVEGAFAWRAHTDEVTIDEVGISGAETPSGPFTETISIGAAQLSHLSTHRGELVSVVVNVPGMEGLGIVLGRVTLVFTDADGSTRAAQSVSMDLDGPASGI